MAITYTAGKPEGPKEFYVERGTYRFRVLEAKEDTSTKGNNMIKMRLRVLLADGNEGPAFNEQLTFTKAALWKVDQFLKCIGQHPGEGEQISIEADDLVGAEGEAELKVREYESKREKRKTNEVAAYLFKDEF